MRFQPALSALALAAPIAATKLPCVVRTPTTDGDAATNTKPANGLPTTPGTAATAVDVLIVGGGATGAWSAVQLVDQGKSVAVIESTDRLGGHVNTFIDPVTGAPIDYGVQAYIVNNQTTDFFARFGVELASAAQSTLPSIVADFALGIVTNQTAPDLTAFVDPITQYVLAAFQFTGLQAGYYDLGDEVAADLLIPFGEFVEKNNLTAVLPVVWQFAQGVGNLLEATTLYVLQNLGVSHLLGLQAGFQYAPAGNQLVFDKAQEFLGGSVSFTSRVVSTTRNQDNSTTVVVTNAQGFNTTYNAKKLLITIPPTLDNLEGFDLSEDETSLFAQWVDIPYYVGVTQDTGLADLTNYINANVTSPVGLPSTPLVWRLESVGVSGYQTVKVIGEADSDAAQALVKKSVGALTQTDGSATKFAAWELHDRLQLHVTPEAIKDGFYKKLYALQGQSGTFWTGNAWASDYSPLLWAYTEERVLPGLLA